WKLTTPAGEVPGAVRGERTLFATRRAALARFLTVAPQQLMRDDEPVVVARQLGAHRFGDGAVGLGVALVLFAVAQAYQHAHRVGVGGEARLALAEQQDLVRPRIADPGEALEELLGF